jgi:hypothetical protein
LPSATASAARTEALVSADSPKATATATNRRRMIDIPIPFDKKQKAATAG